MSNNYESLVSLIRDIHIVEDTTKLEEKGVMSIDISQFPRDSLYTLYKFDPEKYDLFPFFSQSKEASGLRDVCDYILLVDYAERLYILLFELKHSNKDNNKAKRQLNATACLIEYIIKSAERIQKAIDRNQIAIRKILIQEFTGKPKTRIYDVEYDRDKYVCYQLSSIHVRALLK